MERIGAVILAGGKGTRMKSERAKVLHEICGTPMIQYVVRAALSVLDDVTVVVGHQAEDVRKALKSFSGKAPGGRIIMLFAWACCCNR